MKRVNVGKLKAGLSHYLRRRHRQAGSRRGLVFWTHDADRATAALSLGLAVEGH